jgi:hypothetical protein
MLKLERFALVIVVSDRHVVAVPARHEEPAAPCPTIG